VYCEVDLVRRRGALPAQVVVGSHLRRVDPSRRHPVPDPRQAAL